MRQTIKFDKEKYLSPISDVILDPVKRFDNKLYVEYAASNIQTMLLDARIKGIFPMRRIIFLFPFFLLLVTIPVHGQNDKPDSAQNIVKATLSEVQSSNKTVLLLFHATWCGWCKRLEKAFESSEIRPIIDKYYKTARLDVKERGEKIRTHENFGGKELLENYGGTQSGLPFIVFLDKKGTMIANSNVMPKNQNIGYPGSKEEIDIFMKLLKQTAPSMTNAEVHTIANYLERNASQ